MGQVQKVCIRVHIVVKAMSIMATITALLLVKNMTKTQSIMRTVVISAVVKIGKITAAANITNNNIS